MEQNKIKEIFLKIYNGRHNFMTPEIIDYGSINNKYLYELSRGEGIFNRSSKIYGVTVLQLVDGEYKPSEELSNGGFYSREEAMEYLDKIRKEKQ